MTALPDMVDIEWGADGAARIGALTTVGEIASDARIAHAYPGLAAAAGGLATPQIRHIATLGGNLAQRSRCWYFRNPHIACLRRAVRSARRGTATIFMALRSISVPASHRIPRQWRRRSWRMTRRSRRAFAKI